MKRKTPFSVPEVQTVNVKHSDTNTVLTCIHKKLWQNFWVKVWFFYWFTRLKTVGIFSSKVPFTWRWRTPGRWGYPFRWGKNITRVYTQSSNHATPGYTFQYYWMVAKHVDKTNWRANDVFWRFCCSCCNLSELWLPIVTLMSKVSAKDCRVIPPWHAYTAKFDPGWEGYSDWHTGQPASAGHPKMRDNMDRQVTPPKRVTSPIWVPPPPC